MAPPPPASLPTGQRLKMLAKTLQSNSFAARSSYRLAFIFAAATYGIVVYKAHFAHRSSASAGVPFTQLVPRLLLDENVQYLMMALVWLYARQIPVALFPFTIYSIFHVASYLRSYLIPTIWPPTRSADGTSTTHHPWVDTLSRFVKTYHDASMSLVATFELTLLFRILFSALTFSSGSWVLLAVYLVFFRQRYDNSAFVKTNVAHLTARVDAALSHQSTPAAVRQGWETVKYGIARGYQLLDLSKYAVTGPKKAQ
ncbi:hypothetical protein KEM54_005782 [Ascosphaera aggregata]|nr:hypothetical protein KEM54_005782 [Ascosphaera aggregata]